MLHFWFLRFLGCYLTDVSFFPSPYCKKDNNKYIRQGTFEKLFEYVQCEGPELFTMVMYLRLFFESTLREDAPLISCFRDFGGKTAPALSMIGGHAKSFSSRASQALRFNLKEAQYILSKTIHPSRNVKFSQTINDDLTALVLCILEVGWKTERYFLEAIVVLVSTYRCNSKDCRKGRSRVSFIYIVINTK